MTGYIYGANVISTVLILVGLASVILSIIVCVMTTLCPEQPCTVLGHACPHHKSC